MELSGLGYEFVYRFWMDNSLIERFSSHKLSPEIKFVVERRTYFVVKRSDGGGGDEVVDSEKVVSVGEEEDGICLYDFWHRRLEYEYGMSPKEARELAVKAEDFARQKQKELAEDNTLLSLPFIPIAVELDVCTVQKAGEPISEAYGRALRSQHMYPLSLCYIDKLQVLDDVYVHLPVDDYRYEEFVADRIDTQRVLDADFRMDGVDALEQGVCHLCGQKPTIGAQIADLKGCRHRFHHHCIAEWLLKFEKSCPTCRRPVTIF